MKQRIKIFIYFMIALIILFTLYMLIVYHYENQITV